MIKPIAIVGIGPAGLSAAHACRLAGVPFSLFSQSSSRSKIGGAQFLHQPLPLVNDTHDFILRYTLVGNDETYKEKVYGSEPVPFVSMSHVSNGDMVKAWSLLNTYDALFNEFVGDGGRLNVQAVDPFVIQDWLDAGHFSAIVLSAPRPSVCRTHAGMGDRPHMFVSQRVRIKNESVLGDGFDNTIIYDGTPNVSWYRTSRIGGIGSTEWGEGAPDSLPYKDLVTVHKPVRTDCNCWRNETIPVLYVGRFGTWRKGELVHDAFDNTIKLLEGMGILS